MSIDDLKARWRPSPEAEAAAAEALAADPDAYAVITSHVLVGKEYGWWTPDITVEAVEGVHVAADNGDGYRAAREAALLTAAIAAGERPATVGWTVHHRDGWSVFEDILSPPRIMALAHAERAAS